MAKHKHRHSSHRHTVQEFGNDMNNRMDRQARLLSSELSEIKVQLLESLRTVDEALLRLQCLNNIASQLPRPHNNIDTDQSYPQELFRKVGRMTKHGLVLFEDHSDSCEIRPGENQL
jgi:hypothetical protein